MSSRTTDKRWEVADQIEREIRDGRRRPGCKLVTKELAQTYGCSARTAHRALTVLEAIGLVECPGPPWPAVVASEEATVSSAAHRLADEIAGELDRGRWQRQLPPVTQLTRMYETTPSTVHGAIKLLAERGRVVRPLGVAEVANEIEKAILQGSLQPGQHIPTRAQLARRYRCSMATVHRAIKQLRESGVLIQGSAAGRPATVAIRKTT